MTQDGAGRRTRTATLPVRRAPRLGVDVRGSLALTGQWLRLLGAGCLVPVPFALGYRERFWPYLLAAALAAGLGEGLRRLGPRNEEERELLSLREGYLAAAALWLLAALVGAVPYLAARGAPVGSPVEAVFESMSGFTATGSSVLDDLGSLDRSLLLWRQLTQWLGGAGVLLLVLAVLPRLQVEGRLRAEGVPAQKRQQDLSALVRRRVRRYLRGYLALTAALALALAVLGWAGLDPAMDTFTAVGLALSALPGGGFSPRDGSVQAFGPVTQVLLAGAMVLAGLNAALVFRLIRRRQLRPVLRDEELRLYLLMLVAGSVLLGGTLVAAGQVDGPAGLGHAVFQAISVMTSTGYTSVELATWPTVTVMVLVGLMFVGGCAGSLAGSIKLVRHLLVARLVRREVHFTVQPELAEPVRLNGSMVDERTLRGVLAFAMLYLGVFVVGAAVLAVDAAVQGPTRPPVELIAAAAAALGTVGPGAGVAGGTAGYAGFSDVSSVTLIVLMWAGRLELLPVLALFTRSFWRR